MLIRRKSSTDDEYHHEDPLGVFSVITGANAATLSSNVYDAFMGMQYVQGVSKTTQPATCFKAMSEPNMLTGNGGKGMVVPSRGFQVMGKQPVPVKKHQCKAAKKYHHKSPCDTLWCRLRHCIADDLLGAAGGCLAGLLGASISCQTCLAAAVSACLIGASYGVGEITCSIADSVCQFVCGGGIIACFVSAIGGAVGGFLACLNDEFHIV